eukprot:TRINITY_DN104808_c0_g1_i1.p1 TRINITY_DN104808_c0_g1~~TRINITY_DN104808_c0_g1_i1.p1  ORF type:complete len:475 (-),score=55.47 TRINITY_DN104808_c0_g1_i1:538-1962(-)
MLVPLSTRPAPVLAATRVTHACFSPATRSTHGKSSRAVPKGSQAVCTGVTIALFVASTKRRLLGQRRALAAVRAVPIGTAGDRRAAVDGDEVLVHLTGRLEDGTIFDSTDGKEPRQLEIGYGEVVPGFENALLGLREGDKITVELQPEQGYGERDERLVIRTSAASVPPGSKVGETVMLEMDMDYWVPALLVETSDDGSVVLDTNPELAGRTLTFEIELVAFKEPAVRGLEVEGWQGRRFQAPMAIANSSASQLFTAWPDAWPYRPEDFRRQDESDDLNFYDEPRYVTHVDDDALALLSDFYSLQFAQAPQGDFSVLDVCSSWVSHYPQAMGARRVAITGLVEEELAANEQATEYVTQDLNENPRLAFGDDEFDFVTNAASIDYLNKPKEVFQEMHRVLKPGGVAIISFSNRCYASKAIAMWLAEVNNGPEHCRTVANYFHFNPVGGWRHISSADISPWPGRSDPMWIVTAVKT